MQPDHREALRLDSGRGGRGGFPYPWLPLAPPKAGKPHSSFLFPLSVLEVLAIESREK